MPMKCCEVCGTQFRARLSSIRTCGIGCRNRLISKEREQRHKQVKSCVVCDAKFEVGAQDKGRQTCSESCSYELRARKTRGGPEYRCATCGAGFFSPPSQVKAGAGRYCSRACMYARNKASTSRPCIVCGKEFSTPPSQMHVKTCSTECGYKVSHGPNAPHYKGVSRTVIVDGKKKTQRTKFGCGLHNTKRRLTVEQATPKWIVESEVARVYEQAAEMERITGQKYHVDHVVPLISKFVCGLHVQHNLQILPATENLRKHNRHWPDMW